MQIDREIIRDKAKELGFDIVRFTDAGALNKDGEFFKKWLKNGNHADMSWMERAVEKRYQPREIVPDAEAVICLAVNYWQEDKIEKKNYKVARYAWGRDYHNLISKRLKRFLKWLGEKFPESENKAYVDTGPVLEKALAAKAGVGFVGKNSLLITQEFGSWVFLSEVITTLKIKPDELKPPFASCGSCRKCVDACPTGALSEYRVDSRKCIAYHTIENRGDIPAEIFKNMKGYVFGCDICQEVCPHNCRAKKTKEDAFTSHISGQYINRDEILSIESEEKFNERFAGSPVRRAKLKGLKRNVSS